MTIPPCSGFVQVAFRSSFAAQIDPQAPLVDTFAFRDIGERSRVDVPFNARDDGRAGQWGTAIEPIKGGESQDWSSHGYLLLEKI
jgi:hypothetical protein